MSTSTYSKVSTLRTPQNQPAKPKQVLNSAGGYTFQLDLLEQVRRFLILGTTESTYYADAKDRTTEALATLQAAIAQHGREVVDLIVDVSDNGKAKSNTEALFALALAASADDDDTRAYALSKLRTVARTGTHLFEFVGFAHQFRGMGRGLKRAIRGWYTDRTVSSLAVQLVKYQGRKVGGKRISHRLLLGLTRPEPPTPLHGDAFAWAVGKAPNIPALGIRAIDGYNAAHSSPLSDTAEIVDRYMLPFEAVPSEALNDPDVWSALLPHMGLTAVLRNLGRLTALGVLDHSTGSQAVSRLADGGELRKARIHPMSVLFALYAYRSGRGRSGAAWQPKPYVLDALDEAFRLAFQNVEPTGKRRLIALDVSGSMGFAPIMGSSITPRDASAAMALITLAADPMTDVVGFSGGLVPLALSARQRLDDAVGVVSGLPFDRTDCALPMLWAQANGKVYDSFEVYTDSETWFGNVHPHQALTDYRRKMNPEARLVVVGMVSNGFSIADPNDAGSLDVVGFDASAPSVIADFVAGRI